MPTKREGIYEIVNITSHQPVLGELYDMVNEKCLSLSLFSIEDIKKSMISGVKVGLAAKSEWMSSEAKEKMVVHAVAAENEYPVMHVAANTFQQVKIVRSQKDKRNTLNVEAELKMSIMGGLVEVGGSAKYLTDSTQSSDSVSVLMQNRQFTYQARFDPMSNDLTTKARAEMARIPNATHVVTSVVFGYEANFMFERTVKTGEKKEDVEGNLEVSVKSIPGFSIEGKGSVDSRGVDQEHNDDVHVRFYADISLAEDAPTDFARVPAFLAGLRGQVNKTAAGATLGVVKKFTVVPISQIIRKETQVIWKIEDGVCKRVEEILSGIEDNVAALQAMKEDKNAKYFTWWIEKVANMFSRLRQYESDFKDKIHKILPRLRQEHGYFAQVQDLFKKDEASRFSKNNMEQIIMRLKEELSNALALVKALKDNGGSSFSQVDYADWIQMTHTSYRTLSFIYDSCQSQNVDMERIEADESSDDEIDVNASQVQSSDCLDDAKVGMLFGETGAGKSLLGTWMLGSTGKRLEVELTEAQVNKILDLLDDEVTLKTDNTQEAADLFRDKDLQPGYWLVDQSGLVESDFHAAARKQLEQATSFPVKVTFSSQAFQVGSTAQSCSVFPRLSRSANLFGKEENLLVKVMDTPGMNDTGGRDDQFLSEILKLMHQVKKLDYVILVTKIGKVQASLKKTIRSMLRAVGPYLWTKLIIVASAFRLEEDYLESNDPSLMSEDDFNKLWGGFKSELIKEAEITHPGTYDGRPELLNAIRAVPVIPLVLFQPLDPARALARPALRNQTWDKSVADLMDSSAHLKKRMADFCTVLEEVCLTKALEVPAVKVIVTKLPVIRRIAQVGDAYAKQEMTPLKVTVDHLDDTLNPFEVFNLPEGCKFSKKTGRVYGKPEEAGTYDITWKVRNGVGPGEMSQQLRVYPQRITGDAKIAKETIQGCKEIAANFLITNMKDANLPEEAKRAMQDFRFVFLDYESHRDQLVDHQADLNRLVYYDGGRRKGFFNGIPTLSPPSVTCEDNSVTITWQSNTNAESDDILAIQSFYLEMASVDEVRDTQVWSEVRYVKENKSNLYEWKGLAFSTSYKVRVRQLATLGVGEWSAWSQDVKTPVDPSVGKRKAQLIDKINDIDKDCNELMSFHKKNRTSEDYKADLENKKNSVGAAVVVVEASYEKELKMPDCEDEKIRLEKLKRKAEALQPLEPSPPRPPPPGPAPPPSPPSPEQDLPVELGVWYIFINRHSGEKSNMQLHCEMEDADGNAKVGYPPDTAWSRQWRVEKQEFADGHQWYRIINRHSGNKEYMELHCEMEDADGNAKVGYPRDSAWSRQWRFERA